MQSRFTDTPRTSTEVQAWSELIKFPTYLSNSLAGYMCSTTTPRKTNIKIYHHWFGKFIQDDLTLRVKFPPTLGVK